jgi:hypothetical protein
VDLVLAAAELYDAADDASWGGGQRDYRRLVRGRSVEA